MITGAILPNNSVLLTCIVPLYNVVEFIDELAYSLFHQRMDWIEYIFVDDASTDGSGKYLADAISRYGATNTRIVSLESNRGPSSARNIGLDLARGEFVWCLDSDDIVSPAAWNTIKSLLEIGSLDVVILDFLYTKIEVQKKFVETRDSDNRDPTGKSLDFVEERIFHTYRPENRTMASRRVLRREDGVIGALMRDRMFFTWSVIVKRKLYEGVRYPEGKLIEDISTLPKLFFSAENFYFLDMPVVYYRQRHGSLLAIGGRDLYIDLSGSMRLLKEYITAQEIQLTLVEKLEVDTFHLQTLIWSASAFKRAGLMREPTAMAILKEDIRSFKASSEMAGKKALANMKAIGRKREYIVGLLILMHPQLYLIVARLYEGGRRVTRLLYRRPTLGALPR